MKRMIALALCLALCLVLAACGQKTPPAPDGDVSQGVSDVSDNNEVSMDDTTTETDKVTTTDEVAQDTTTDEVAEDTTTETEITTTEAVKDTTTVADKVTTTSSTEKTTTEKTTKTTTTKQTVTDKTTKATTTKGTSVDKTTTKATTTEKVTTKTTITSKATTVRTKKTVTGKTSSTTATVTTYSTTSTKKTSAATTTSKDVTPKKSIRILAVGNSFSVDAMKNHLFDVLESLGYNDITLGNLYVAGCSIDTHWTNVSENKTAYTYYQTNRYGVWNTSYNKTIDVAFGDTDWDVITVQQASPDSGRSSTFGNLSKLVGWLKDKCPDAKILYHMTWAYQKDSTHWAFPAYYGSDQARMYNDIVTTTRDTAAKTAGIAGVIPAGTAIQNLRTSTLGDTLTSDGHHLSDSYGDYTTAVTWACYITGEDAQKVTYRPDEVAAHFDEIAEAVNHALATPYAITPCA